MNIKNCPKCKKIFSPINGKTICDECHKKEEEQFAIVRDYLRENRGADINVVSEETGVSTKKILKYLREGRLEVSEGMSDFLKCEKCGVSIKSGTYCKNCSEKMANKLQSAIMSFNSENKDSNLRMHTRRV